MQQQRMTSTNNSDRSIFTRSGVFTLYSLLHVTIPNLNDAGGIPVGSQRDVCEVSSSLMKFLRWLFLMPSSPGQLSFKPMNAISTSHLVIGSCISIVILQWFLEYFSNILPNLWGEGSPGFHILPVGLNGLLLLDSFGKELADWHSIFDVQSFLYFPWHPFLFLFCFLHFCFLEHSAWFISWINLDTSVVSSLHCLVVIPVVFLKSSFMQ